MTANMGEPKILSGTDVVHAVELEVEDGSVVANIDMPWGCRGV
jgi:hypothetical protein